MNVSKLRAFLIAVFATLPLAADAAITPVNVSSANLSSGASVTPSEPTNTAQDDFVLAWCIRDLDGGTWTDPADFTEIDQLDWGTTGNASFYVGYKVRGATAGSGYTFSHSITTEPIICTLMSLRGIDTTTPLDVVYVRANHYKEDTNELAAAQPITTATNGAWVVLLYHEQSDTAFTAGSPTGYTNRFLFTTANRQQAIETKEVATAGTETPGTWNYTDLATTAVMGEFTLAIRPAASGVAVNFTNGPNVAAAANGYTISGTVNGTGFGALVVESVGVNPGAPAPTCAQVKAGQDGNGVAAPLNNSETWTTDVGNDFLLTLSGAWAKHDVHTCATDGTNDTAVTSANDQVRSEDASQGIVTLASVAATSPFAVQTVANCDTTLDSATVTGCGDTSWLEPGMLVDLSAGFADLTNVIVESVTGDSITFETAANATSANITVTQDGYFLATVAAGDVAEIDDNAAGGNTDAVTLGTDGTLSFTPTNPGVYTTIDYNIQDVSHASDGDLSPVQWADGDDVLHLFSTRPDIDDDFGSEALLLYANQAMAEVTVPCTDPDAQAVTITARGTPTGTSVSSAGAWTGTPTVEDETGTAYTMDCADSGALYATPAAIDVYVTDDDVAAPDCVTGGVDVAACLASLDAVRGWLDSGEQLTATFAFSLTVAAGDIISQNPAAAASMTATDPLAVVVSLGAGGGKRGLPRLGLGVH